MHCCPSLLMLEGCIQDTSWWTTRDAHIQFKIKLFYPLLHWLRVSLCVLIVYLAYSWLHACSNPWWSYPHCSVFKKNIVFSRRFSKWHRLLMVAEIVADLYQKMLKSVNEVRTMPPNANLWSLVENCTNREDIKLLLQILQRLRVFVSPAPLCLSHACLCPVLLGLVDFFLNACLLTCPCD